MNYSTTDGLEEKDDAEDKCLHAVLAENILADTGRHMESESSRKVNLMDIVPKILRCPVTVLCVKLFVQSVLYLHSES